MPMAYRLHVGASKIHKWLSLVIGVQLLLWFASGALMSLLPIDKVRGEHIVNREGALGGLPLGMAGTIFLVLRWPFRRRSRTT